VIELAQKTTEITPSNEYKIMDTQDEQQILDELQGHYLTEFVYSFKVGGRDVIGLSWAGIKELAYRYGGIQVESCNIEDKGDFWLVTCKALDIKRCNSRFGVATQSKTMKRRDGSIEPDEFALQKATSKAQRNAMRALMPEIAVKQYIDQFLTEKNGKAPEQTPPYHPAQPQQSVPKNVTPKPIATSEEPAPKTNGKHLDIDPETLTILTASTQIQDERIKQYQITPDGNNQIGMINVLDDVVSIVPYQANLRRDHTAFTNFLFPKILDAMCGKHGCEYEAVGTQEGALLYILVKGKLEEKQVKELLTPTRWAFLKANEQNGNQQA
jgi:hypothetical protein